MSLRPFCLHILRIIFKKSIKKPKILTMLKNDDIEVWLNPNPRCVKTRVTAAKYFTKNYKASVLCDVLKYNFYKGFMDFLYYI